LASKLKGKKLVYDSHEYFTGVPELIGRPRVQKIWKRIERRIVPKLPFMITVNDSIAGLFKQEYNIPVLVIRNVPIRNGLLKTKSRTDLDLPIDKTILIVQGRGINVDRGIEEAVEAMQLIENTLLLIIGGGDVYPVIEKRVQEKNLQEKVRLIQPIGREELFQYTANADIGLTLDKDTNINYRFSLPNKIFDYINAGCAVLSSNLPEVAKIVKQYEIGSIASNHSPEAIALTINNMISDRLQLNVWRENASKASEELCWENESQKLYEKLGEYFG
jgi:glycosyltransferase involved in cell wall biosynthesis